MSNPVDYQTVWGLPSWLEFPFVCCILGAMFVGVVVYGYLCLLITAIYIGILFPSTLSYPNPAGGLILLIGVGVMFGLPKLASLLYNQYMLFRARRIKPLVWAVFRFEARPLTIEEVLERVGAPEDVIVTAMELLQEEGRLYLNYHQRPR